MPTASIIGASIALIDQKVRILNYDSTGSVVLKVYLQKTKMENNLRNETMQMLTILMNGATHHTSLNATQANVQPQYKAKNKENQTVLS